MDIEELIERGETQSVEFKESLRLKDEIGETVSAFSISDGGVVLVGISDGGGVPGVDIGKSTVEELANYIKRYTDPQVFPSVKTVEVGEKKHIAVELLDMIKQCREWRIPEPVFEHISGAFVVTFRLLPAMEDLEKLGLNERQLKAMDYVIKKGSISNKEHTSLNNISRKMATLDLTQLVTKGLLVKVGKGKRDIRYILSSYAKFTQNGGDSFQSD